MNLIPTRLVSTILLAGYFMLAALPQAKAAPADTVKLNYNEAEALFIRNNFALLVQRYNVDMAEAAKKQAGLWANPVVFAEVNAYNPHTQKWFQTSSYVDPTTGNTNYGTYNLQLNQLVRTAGKRNKTVALAETNVKLQKAAFDELMRQMRLDLFNAYTDLYLNQQVAELLKGEQKRVKELVEAEKFALNKGAASGYEVTRLQFELQNLQVQLNGYLDAIADSEQALNTIFCNTTFMYYTAAQLPELGVNEITIAQLNDSAVKNRPDLRTAQYSAEQSAINLRLQKATAVPDLVFGANYDRNGGAYLNYTGLNVSMPLPVFNRNQGNVQAARIQTLQAQADLQLTGVAVAQDVYNSFQRFNNALDVQKQLQPGYEASLQDISTEATANYNKRTISLLDYIDKTRTYRDARINLLQLQNAVLQSKQYINYTCNAKLF